MTAEERFATQGHSSQVDRLSLTLSNFSIHYIHCGQLEHIGTCSNLRLGTRPSEHGNAHLVSLYGYPCNKGISPCVRKRR